jgi:catechol 2,3-dioxygenase-like lactoylglutathione lyase family enzyme
MIYELNHIGVFVSDLPKSSAFYTDLFGGREIWRTSIEAAGIDIVYLQVAGGFLELISARDGSQAARLDHLAFLSDDLDGDYAKLVGAGYESMIAPRVSGSGVGRQAFVLDGDGGRIELLQRDLPNRSEIVEHPVVVSIDHFSVHTSRIEKALEFYRDLLGMRLLTGVSIPVTNPKVTYLDLGYDVLQVITGMESPRRFDHLAFRVHGVDQALDYFAGYGVTPDGPSEAAASGLGRVAHLTDPDGLDIEIIDRPGVRDL